MSETTETAPKSVRQLRHEIRELSYKLNQKLAGRSGLTKEDQIGKVQKATRVLGEMLTKMTELATLVHERDFDAHQAEKKAAKEKLYGEFNAVVSDLGEDEDDDEDDSGINF